ncbi:M23 family metallopeptidase [Candidatus Xenohaliotis californiensis]
MPNYLQKIILLSLLIILGYGIFIKIKLNIQSNQISKISQQTRCIQNENNKLKNELQKTTKTIETIASYFESMQPSSNQRANSIKERLSERIETMEKALSNTQLIRSAKIAEQLNKIQSIRNICDKEDLSSISTIGNQIHQLIILEQLMDQLPFGAPFINTFRKTSGFGNRKNPVNGKISFHGGIDMASELNATIYSTANGVVKFAGSRGSYGNIVEIDHGNNISTLYAHLSKTLVKKHQKINKNTAIGKMGSSGRSTSPHLHYEIRINKERIDPNKFLTITKNESSK